MMDRDETRDVRVIISAMNKQLKSIQRWFAKELENELIETEMSTDEFMCTSIFEDHTNPLIMSFGQGVPWEALEARMKLEGGGWQEFQQIYLNNQCVSARATRNAMFSFKENGPAGVIYYKEARVFFSRSIDELFDTTLEKVNDFLLQHVSVAAPVQIVRIPGAPGLLSLATAETGELPHKLVDAGERVLIRRGPVQILEYLADTFETSYRKHCYYTAQYGDNEVRHQV